MADVARLHYVYAHRRASDGRLFYIGKGKDRRAWQKHSRSRQWLFIARKHGFEVELVRSNLPECCALTLEQIAIAIVGFENLANATLGGGGIAGWRHSDDAKRKISEAGKGRVQTEKQRIALAQYCRQNFTPEYREKMSQAARRRTDKRSHSAETRAKIAASHLGIKPSAETVAKMRLAKIGKAVGRDSPSYDHTVRTWQHNDGREFTGTRAEIITAFSLGDSCVSSVINRRQKTVKGWRLK